MVCMYSTLQKVSMSGADYLPVLEKDIPLSSIPKVSSLLFRLIFYLLAALWTLPPTFIFIHFTLPFLTLSHTLSLSLSVSFSISHSVYISLYLSLSLSHTHSVSLSPSLSLSLCLSLSLSQKLTLTHILFYTSTFTLPFYHHFNPSLSFLLLIFSIFLISGHRRTHGQIQWIFWLYRST